MKESTYESIGMCQTHQQAHFTKSKHTQIIFCPCLPKQRQMLDRFTVELIKNHRSREMWVAFSPRCSHRLMSTHTERQKCCNWPSYATLQKFLYPSARFYIIYLIYCCFIGHAMKNARFALSYFHFPLFGFSLRLSVFLLSDTQAHTSEGRWEASLFAPPPVSRT